MDKALSRLSLQSAVANAPSMITVAQRVADAHNLKTRTQKYRLDGFKKHVATVNFMIMYQINDVEQLSARVRQISDRHIDVSERIKGINRWLEALEKHFFMNKCRKQNKGVYEWYAKITNPKQKQAFCEKHEKEIELYTDVRDYFKGVMNGRKDPLSISK